MAYYWVLVDIWFQLFVIAKSLLTSLCIPEMKVCLFWTIKLFYIFPTVGLALFGTELITSEKWEDLGKKKEYHQLMLLIELLTWMRIMFVCSIFIGSFAIIIYLLTMTHNEDEFDQNEWHRAVDQFNVQVAEHRINQLLASVNRNPSKEAIEAAAECPICFQDFDSADEKPIC